MLVVPRKFVGYVSFFNSFVTKAKPGIGLGLRLDEGLSNESRKDVVTSENQVVPRKKSAKPSETKKVVSHSKEILNYFETNNTIDMNCLPQKVLKRKHSVPEILYIVDKDVAKQFVNTIKPYILRGNCPILEANPGVGLVTEELLSLGIPRLHLYEPAASFNIELQKLVTKYPDQIDVQKADLFLLYKHAFQDRIDGGSRVTNLLSGVTKRPWTEEPAMKIVGALPNVTFLKHLIISFVFQNGIMMYGRPELYLVIPPPLYIHLTCSKSAGYLQYRATTVLFQLIFRSKLLGKVPRKAYLPWETEYKVLKKSKLTKVRSVDPEYLYLVRIEPREEFFEKVVPPDKLQPLWYFIRQTLLSRKNQVIPQLEKWIPGCGPRLIVGGLNIFTQFGDLTPEEILGVFIEFSSWPEYPHCTFLPSMDTNFIKMETITDELDKVLEESVEADEHESIEEDAEDERH